MSHHRTGAARFEAGTEAQLQAFKRVRAEHCARESRTFREIGVLGCVRRAARAALAPLLHLRT